MIKDIVYILIILALLVGWINAVVTQQQAISNISSLYNHLVGECNKVIGASHKENFCLTLPNGNIVCEQNDLNIFLNHI